MEGVTCEHWRSSLLQWEGCRWKNIEVFWATGSTDDGTLQTLLATEIELDAAIPERIRNLAQ